MHLVQGSSSRITSNTLHQHIIITTTRTQLPYPLKVATESALRLKSQADWVARVRIP